MKGNLAKSQTILKLIWQNSKFILAWLVVGMLPFPLHKVIAQHTNDQIIINADGIMRWRADGKEITGFGVNYTVPFAHAFRSGKKLGIDLKQAIDQDVRHFARLGLDLYRVHVWDCEISDTLGNLLDNEHLELFDYLLFRLQEHHINAIITPIAFWGNGWPDPNEPTPGFSHKYGKDSCLVDPNAIRAQENYLAQFVNHTNRYTAVAYKNDPHILAFEISNEPHHQGTPEEVTRFVSGMKDAIRSTGCTKPVFYNVSHSIHLAEAYYDAGIDGGTFQWYPTGLGYQKEIGGNMLPNVDTYDIPFADLMKKEGSARIVYEFDAADMASTYMYPAMARSFRTAGIQLATHFSYDPTFLAPYNTEYNTHYMNLLYAPGKALSLMICAEVFRQIPLYKDYGAYPDNASFGPFRVDYESDLAEMVTAEKFIYTNHTKTVPSATDKLELIAGRGNSVFIAYDGSGAYFLDKLGDGQWQLEVLPDVTQIRNLFGRNSLEQKVAVLLPEKRKMKISLPGLEDGFVIRSADTANKEVFKGNNAEAVDITPGTYFITRADPSYSKDLLKRSGEPITWDGVVPLPKGEISPIHTYNSARKSDQLSASAVMLFSATRDHEWLHRKWYPGSGLQKDEVSGEEYYYVKINGLAEVDPENRNGPVIADYTLHHYFGDLVSDRKDDLLEKKSIVIHAGTTENKSFPVQVSLIMKDGSAFGGRIMLDPSVSRYHLSLSDLKRVNPVLMPRPYPTFLPYYSEAGDSKKLDLREIESLQISIGPGMAKEDWGNSFELKLSSISLEN